MLTLTHHWLDSALPHYSRTHLQKYLADDTTDPEMGWSSVAVQLNCVATTNTNKHYTEKSFSSVKET